MVCTGIHGHKTVVKGDVWGAVERGSGRLVLELYDKVKQGDLWERRFGPPRADELETLCAAHIAPHSLLYTDGARAYKQIAAKIPYLHAYVDHSSGMYSTKVKLGGQTRSVYTNTIDGCWGRLKVWINARGGVAQDYLYENLKEYQWRVNLGDKDPFITLCEHIRDGYFPL